MSQNNNNNNDNNKKNRNKQPYPITAQNSAGTLMPFNTFSMPCPKPSLSGSLPRLPLGLCSASCSHKLHPSSRMVLDPSSAAPDLAMSHQVFLSSASRSHVTFQRDLCEPWEQASRGPVFQVDFVLGTSCSLEKSFCFCAYLFAVEVHKDGAFVYLIHCSISAPRSGLLDSF